MIDYTVFGRAIAKALAELEEPLNERQYLFIQGLLGGFQMTIESEGLETAIERIGRSIEGDE